MVVGVGRASRVFRRVVAVPRRSGRGFVVEGERWGVSVVIGGGSEVVRWVAIGGNCFRLHQLVV